MKKELVSKSRRKSSNLFLENLIVGWIELDIFIKYLLNIWAMYVGLLNVILFSTTAECAEFEVHFRDISFLVPF